MTNKGTIFIIPGYKHGPNNKAYKEIANMFRREGYFPIPVKIDWRETTISENTQYFLEKYRKVASRKKYILGFSYGAMIAFLASTKVSVSGVLLCSLSPYFKEDLIKYNDELVSSVTKLRYQDFLGLKCRTLSKQVKARQVHLLYGESEEKILRKRSTSVFGQILLKRKKLIQIKNTEHDIGDKKYLSTIYKVIKDLN